MYHRQQEYSSAEYKKWLEEDTAKKELQKEQTERDALLAAAGGKPVTNQVNDDDYSISLLLCLVSVL